MYLFYLRLTICIVICKICVAQVIDTNLDILFILDQTKLMLTMIRQTMAEYREECVEPPFDLRPLDFCMGSQDVAETYCLYKNAYSGLIAWVNSYFDAAYSEKTRFAVIYSCSREIGGVMHLFKDGNFKQKIPGLLEGGKIGMSDGCRKRMVWSFQLAVNEVFSESNGYRKNAISLIIYVSDCSMPAWLKGLHNDTYNAVDQFFLKVKGQMFFVCYDYKSPFREQMKEDADAFNTIISLVLRKNNQSDRSFIYLHENDVDVGENLNFLLPKKSGVSELNCKQYWDCTNYTTPNGTEKCFQSCQWKIAQKPTENGKNCTHSEDPFETWIPCATGTPSPTVAPNIAPLLLGIVCAIVALIALLVIALFFVRRKRQKSTAKNKSLSAVKLETETSKPSELSKQSAIGAESKVVGQRSTIASVAKSVSQRSKISVGSKNVGQSSKVGSVSKAVSKQSEIGVVKKSGQSRRIGSVSQAVSMSKSAKEKKAKSDEAKK